jgi:hypothetical protein
VTVVVASLVLGAVLACPCPEMAADGHGCCADAGSRIGASDCCRPGPSPAQTSPRSALVGPAASPWAIVVEPAMAVPLPPRTVSAMTLPASPPRILRI